MILILTHSLDGTTDLIIKNIDYPVYRLNIDLWKNYQWNFNTHTFNFVDPLNRIIKEDDVKCVYFRKLFFNIPEPNILSAEENWIQSEITHIFKEIYNQFYKRKKVALVDPVASRYCGKISQMRIAEKYFKVPHWEIFKGNFHKQSMINLDKKFVVKSLESELLENGKFLFTKEIEVEKLDPDIPWFIQEKILGNDFTVAYINGSIFGYELEKKDSNTDWRQFINLEGNHWELKKLSREFENKVIFYMNELNLQYGRLDFIKYKNDFYFLEVNPNGQWGWLDMSNENGLLKAVIKELKTIASA